MSCPPCSGVALRSDTSIGVAIGRPAGKPKVGDFFPTLPMEVPADFARKAPRGAGPFPLAGGIRARNDREREVTP
jgi:hypothetical protein